MSALRVGHFVGSAGYSGVGGVGSVEGERGKDGPFESIAGPVVQAQHAAAALRLPVCPLATARECWCDSSTEGWGVRRVRGSGAPRRHASLTLCPNVLLRADGTRACARRDWWASNSVETRRAGVRECGLFHAAHPPRPCARAGCRGATLDG